MSKELKLNVGEENMTDILAKKIMPKSDFKKVIEHDKLYFNTMKQLFNFQIRKTELLGNKVIGLISKNEEVDKNINEIVEWSEMQLKNLDLKAKMKIQEKLIEDKEMHFESIFLPQYKREVEEMNKSFEDVLKNSNQLIKDYQKEKSPNKKLTDVVKKVNFELSWWNKTSEKDQKNEEFKLGVWKPLKRLLSALVKIKEEIKQEEKYKINTNKLTSNVSIK
jgi:hypothetical protein